MKTAEEHNRYLGYAHLAFGSFQLLMTLVMVAISFLIFGAILAEDKGAEFPAGMVAIIFIFASFIQLLFSVPSLVAAFGLLKRKTWAKTATMIAGVLSAMSFPFGLAVCVYSFWFIFSPGGKQLYDRQVTEIGSRPISFLDEPQDPNAVGRWGEQKREYVPPKEMPDWR